jgi:charged multivesicular body protein 4
MDGVREQMELTNEISDAISHPVGLNNDADEVRITLCLSPQQ